MTHLKKMFFALAVVLGLGLLGASSASAQVNCTAFSVPTLVRSQGLTELAGSISLNCGGVALAAPASITVTITPPTAVVTNDTANNPTVTNTPAAAVVGPVTVSGNTVTIAVAAGVLNTIAIAGIRVNAAASGVVFPAQIAALVTASPANAIAVTNNQLNVAIPQSAVTVAFSAGAGLPQCSSATFAGASDAPTTIAITAIPSAGTFATAALTIAGKAITGGTTARVTITEGYPAAFHTKANEGLGATQGTRVALSVTGLPTNVVMYAPELLFNLAVGSAGVSNAAFPPAAPPNGSMVMRLVAGTGTDGSGGALSGGAPAVADLVTGTTVVYEIVSDDDANVTSIVIPIQFYTTGTATTGTIGVTALLAPTSTIGTATTGGTGIIPRFTPTGAGNGTATSIIGCTTNILFPFVTNQVGFNTGFSLANTTTDPFGTSSQSGTCVYNFYGNNAPSGGTFTTPSISGGASDTQLLSTIAPNFQGYIIVQCNFQLGHGFFFVQNGFGGGTPNVSQGGPGLIILQPGTTSSTSRKGLAAVGPPFGEGLGH